MAEFKWIRVCLCVILVPRFTATSNRPVTSSVVRAGDEVTLPCKNRTDDGRRCDSLTWAFKRSPKAAADDLVVLGQIRSSRSKADRLSVGANCSLVVRKVTEEDVGRYTCQQSSQSGKNHTWSTLYLSVIIMTEQKDDDKVTLSCSVSTYDKCRRRVKWLYEGKDSDSKDLKLSQSRCSATAHLTHTFRSYELLKCSVKGKKSGNVQKFTFSRRGAGKNTSASADEDTTRKAEQRWVYAAVAIGLAALLITALSLFRWKRNKGNKTQMDENLPDPEDGVSYASISLNKNSKAWVRGGDETVTYATVTPSSSSSFSSAGASADPGNLYATIN